MPQLLGFLIGHPFLEAVMQHVRQADQRGQRSFQFVAEDVKHAVFHAAGQHRFRLGRAQRPFRLAIADDELRMVGEQRPVDRFGHERRGTEIVGPVDRCPVVVGGADHHRQVDAPRVLPDVAKQFETVHLRHADVDDGQLEAVLADEARRNLAVLGLHEFIVEGRQLLANDLAHDRIIVDDEDAAARLLGASRLFVHMADLRFHARSPSS